MSGVEVAGVVLGTLPLIIAALEGYSTAVGGVVDLTPLNREIRRLKARAEVEFFAFQQLMEAILEKTDIGDTERDALVKGDPQMWGEQGIRAIIHEYLGQRTEFFIDLSMKYAQILSGVASELQKTLSGHSEASKGLRFSIKRKHLEQQLRHAQRIRKDLEHVIEKHDFSQASERLLENSSRQKSLRDYQRLRQDATTLYRILSAAKRAKSPISLYSVGIYPVGAVVAGSVSTFSILYEQFARNHFKIDVKIAPLESGQEVLDSSHSQSPDNQRRVRFAHTENLPLDSHDPAKDLVKTVRTDSVDTTLPQFLRHLRDRSILSIQHQPTGNDVTLSVHELRRSRRVNLRDLLKWHQMALLNRMCLCIEIVRAFWLFHGTGLIPEILTLDDFRFSTQPNDNTACLDIFMGDLLLSLGIPDSKFTPEREENVSSRTAFSERLSSLGIVLIEILLSREIKPYDGQHTISREKLANARIELENLAMEVSNTWYDVVKRCLSPQLEGNIDWASQQNRFYQQFLKPLEESLSMAASEKPMAQAKIVVAKGFGPSLFTARRVIFPAAITEKTIRTARLGDPSAFQELKQYVGSMRMSCAAISWLNDALSKEVQSFDEILLELEQIRPSDEWDSSKIERIEVITQQCLREICTIPHTFELETPNRHKELEALQIQLRLGTLELSSLLAELHVPGSPALSAITFSPSEDSMFEGQASTLTSQSSVFGNDDMILPYLDSKGVVGELLINLQPQHILSPKPFTSANPIHTDKDFRSKLRHVLETYCAELRIIYMNKESSQQLFQGRFYMQAHSMVAGEIEFLSEQLISIWKGDINDGDFQPKGITKTEHAVIEKVPEIVVEDFLLGGKAFGRLRLHLRKLAQQDNMQIIQEEVVQNLPLELSGLYNALFHVRWELFDYIKSADIGKLLTVTGGAMQAYASVCTDYLNQQWSDSKFEICSHLDHYLKQSPRAYEHPDSTLLINPLEESHNGIMVIVTGSKQTIISIAQQLAWLTAALRPCKGGLFLSDVDFIATRGMEFFIEPGAYTKISEIDTDPELCWHRLFGSAAIAHGFPIPSRSGQIGLELPLTVMLNLSRVSSFLATNRRLAFYGYSSLLFPVDKSSDKSPGVEGNKQCIQWHFERSKECIQYLDCADYLAESRCAWASDINRHSLTTSRHFVGFCRVADICLATSNSKFDDLRESALPDASTTGGVVIESVTLGTSSLGIFTAEAESSIIYPRNVLYQVVPDEYLGTLDTTKKLSMILWDCQDRCGWLVPTQALLLHMAHIWTQSHGIIPTFRYAKEGISYLHEVDKILREDRRKVLRAQGRDDDTDFELRHLIMRFWADIRGCMLAQQSAIRDNKGAIGYQAGKILGWELMDFITRPPLEFALKHDEHGPSDNIWKALAAEKNIPVLFCQGAGNIIRPATSGSLCGNCKLPLKQECHLVASLASLNYLAQKYGGIQAMTKLTPKWGWKPSDESAMFSEHCSVGPTKTCHERLQKLIPIKDEGSGQVLQLPATGAVVFGRPASASSVLVPTTSTDVPASRKGVKNKLVDKWNRFKNRNTP